MKKDFSKMPNVPVDIYEFKKCVRCIDNNALRGLDYCQNCYTLDLMQMSNELDKYKNRCRFCGVIMPYYAINDIHEKCIVNEKKHLQKEFENRRKKENADIIQTLF
jgi:hypothetical protein